MLCVSNMDNQWKNLLPCWVIWIKSLLFPRWIMASKVVEFSSLCFFLCMCVVDLLWIALTQACKMGRAQRGMFVWLAVLVVVVMFSVCPRSSKSNSKMNKSGLLRYPLHADCLCFCTVHFVPLSRCLLCVSVPKVLDGSESQYSGMQIGTLQDEEDEGAAPPTQEEPPEPFLQSALGMFVYTHKHRKTLV